MPRSRRGTNAIFITVLGFAFVALSYGLPADASSSLATGAGSIDPAAPKSMVQLLKELAANQDPKSLPYLNDRRADIMADLVKASTDDDKQLKLEKIYADELLKAGRCSEAIEEYNHLRDDIVKVTGADPPASFQTYLLQREAVAYLRYGEVQNCCASNNADSCLIPIRGRGIHTRTEGSRYAITCLNQLLAIDASDLQSRWLLNIAYMTLGEYPAKVPKQWPTSLLTRRGSLPMSPMRPGSGVGGPSLAVN